MVDIGVAIDMTNEHLRGTLRGVAKYVHAREGWRLRYCSPALGGLRWLQAQGPAGLVLGALEATGVEQARALGIPTVSVGRSVPGWPSHRIGSDELAIGEIAAMYLLSRGHKTFCYISRTEGLQQARGEGFTRTLARHGFTCTMLDPPDDALDTVSTRRAADAFSARLAQMPKPVAILCHNDWLGWVVAEHCRAIGLRIPEEISLMGVDNDVTICTLCEPPLSSVQTAAERIGYEAAQVLDLLLEGRAPASRALRVPPVRVVERRSTDAMLAQDEVVARALRYMQQHLREAGGVLELSRRVGCSRRNLERRFVNATGSTPAHSWARLRVNEAQRLLAETDLGMGDVAHLSGFTSGVQLSVTFRRYTGLSPSQFRRRAQP